MNLYCFTGFILCITTAVYGGAIPDDATAMVPEQDKGPAVKIGSRTIIDPDGGTRIISDVHINPNLQLPNGGVNYIRWGRTTCPDTNGTELLYSGVAAGAFYNQQGGGSNRLCLPDDPEWLEVSDGVQSHRNYVYGSEYQTEGISPAFGALYQHNVPCAACYTAERVNRIMIPAKVNCMPSWTREYYGYLMTQHHDQNRNSFECIDVDAEAIPGSAANTNGALFHFTEARCNGIKCPPYTEGHELACVVCTK